jgi:hypothetical protein
MGAELAGFEVTLTGRIEASPEARVPFSRFDLRPPQPLDLAITKTIDERIVYHSNRLHVRIPDAALQDLPPIRKRSILLSAVIAATRLTP